MNHHNRDLIVVINQTTISPKALEREVSLLHELLFEVERLDNVATAFEVLDLQRYKKITAHHQVKYFFRMHAHKEKPFVFLFNKN